jgi:hypothetical protein
MHAAFGDQKMAQEKTVSRKGAKAQRKQLVFLCAFAPLREILFLKLAIQNFKLTHVWATVR